VGVHPDELAGHKVTALEALEWLENLESSFFDFAKGYQAPFCSISDFLQEREPHKCPKQAILSGSCLLHSGRCFPGCFSFGQTRTGRFLQEDKSYEKGNLLGWKARHPPPCR